MINQIKKQALAQKNKSLASQEQNSNTPNTNSLQNDSLPNQTKLFFAQNQSKQQEYYQQQSISSTNDSTILPPQSKQHSFIFEQLINHPNIYQQKDIDSWAALHIQDEKMVDEQSENKFPFQVKINKIESDLEIQDIDRNNTIMKKPHRNLTSMDFEGNQPDEELQSMNILRKPPQMDPYCYFPDNPDTIKYNVSNPIYEQSDVDGSSGSASPQLYKININFNLKSKPEMEIEIDDILESKSVNLFSSTSSMRPTSLKPCLDYIYIKNHAQLIGNDKECDKMVKIKKFNNIHREIPQKISINMPYSIYQFDNKSQSNDTNEILSCGEKANQLLLIKNFIKKQMSINKITKGVNLKCNNYGKSNKIKTRCNEMAIEIKKHTSRDQNSRNIKIIQTQCAKLDAPDIHFRQFQIQQIPLVLQPIFQKTFFQSKKNSHMMPVSLIEDQSKSKLKDKNKLMSTQFIKVSQGEFQQKINQSTQMNYQNLLPNHKRHSSEYYSIPINKQQEPRENQIKIMQFENKQSRQGRKIKIVASIKASKMSMNYSQQDTNLVQKNKQEQKLKLKQSNNLTSSLRTNINELLSPKRSIQLFNSSRGRQMNSSNDSRVSNSSSKKGLSKWNDQLSILKQSRKRDGSKSPKIFKQSPSKCHSNRINGITKWNQKLSQFKRESKESKNCGLKQKSKEKITTSNFQKFKK